MLIAGPFLWLGGTPLNVIVKGGATRNLVVYLLWDAPVRQLQGEAVIP